MLDVLKKRVDKIWFAFEEILLEGKIVLKGRLAFRVRAVLNLMLLEIERYINKKKLVVSYRIGFQWLI